MSVTARGTTAIQLQTREKNMPAKSKAMRRLMAIAEHHPEEVSAKNKGVLSMTHQQLHEFADTPEKGLPEHTKKSRPGKRVSR